MKNKVQVVCGDKKRIVALKSKGTLTIFRLGDAKRGWVPNRAHFESFIRMLKAWDKDNRQSIVFHYAVDVLQVEIGGKK